MIKFLAKPKLIKCCYYKRFISTTHRCFKNKINVCVIGSGPAGFYTAQQVLKNPNVHVDIYEKLPIPFGLVRFGVAPDHPEVKNVINSFTTTASNPRCQFLGNISLGKDVTLSELRKAYNCVVLCYGADQDSPLGIPGENLDNVVSARKFVGWYNGLPADSALKINLDVETATVIGHGNVALDVARILLTPIDKLKATDITENSLEKLSKSRVKRVVLIGRRGPLQVAFTIKELRELVKLDNCRPVINSEDFKDCDLNSLPRPRKRLTELMMQAVEKSSQNATGKEWELKFCRSPVRLIDSGGAVGGIELGVNELQGEGDKVKAVLTDRSETLDCQLVLRSIGYKSLPVEDTIPFDNRRGIIPNEGGKVVGSDGLFCSGWVKTGPVGVIVSTMSSSFETGQAILKDIEVKDGPELGGSTVILKLLKDRGVKVVTFEDWKKIDAFEQRQGENYGKPREKMLSVEEMLKLV